MTVAMESCLPAGLIASCAFEPLADHAESLSPRSSKTTIGTARIVASNTYRQTDIPEMNFLEADLRTTLITVGM